MNKRFSRLLALIVVVFSISFGLSFIKHEDAQAYGSCTQYGYNAIYDYLSGGCKCMTGYMWGTDFMGNDVCVSAATVCRERLGFGSTYSYLSGSCECSSGYVLDTDYSGKLTCTSGTSYCWDKYGFNSRFNSLSESCECGMGYMWGTDIMGRLSCVSGASVCHDQHGLHSSYNSLNDTCSCDSGYIFDENDRCVEKQNNAYFTLKDIDTGERKAIIESDYSRQNFLIEYSASCFSSSFQGYLDEQIVVNMGTDFYVDAWDKIVLQDHDQVCDITSVQIVSAGTKLQIPDNEPEPTYVWVPTTPTSPASTSVTPYSADKKLTDRMRGRILLQVESHGEAWYVHPVSGLRYYMQDGPAAYQMMRNFSLGISNSDLDKIPSVEDSQSMLNATSVCGTNLSAGRLRGKILLQVESHGEAWYVHPDKCRRIYMKDGEAAYTIMRYLSLGITNVDLGKLAESDL